MVTAGTIAIGSKGQRVMCLHLSLVEARQEPHPGTTPLPSCPVTTYDVIHQVSDGPDEDKADEWGKEGEPGHRGDLRKDTLTDTVVHTNPPPLTLPTTASHCPPI